MARAATADELTSLRTSGQRSKLYLAIHKPPGVYSARVNQSSFIDPVSQITYDGGSGTLTDVLPGMTMYVGSSAGAYDVGMVRIRKSPSATIFYIGETSEIAWADNLYLTVVDEVGLWPRIPVNIGETLLMDTDITYSDQHTNFEPVPVLGPHAVLWLTDETVDFEPDAGDSWALGSTISAYSWSAPGSSATSGMDTDKPLISYNAAGTYRVSCQVTAANGKTATGYRYIFVYDDDHLPATNFDLERCSGDWGNGGWSFEVKMYDQAALSSVRERALAVLFAADWYGETKTSVGPVVGYENVIAIGWVAGETISWDPQAGTVQFRVDGPASWMKKLAGTPLGLNWRASGSDAWEQCDGLTVDMGLYHLLRWRSTATLCIDLLLSGSSKLITNLSADGVNLYGQLEELSNWLLAKPLCDRYGRLIVETDLQLLEISDRSEIPTVMEITKRDWGGELEIERNTVRGTAAVELSAFMFDGTTEASVYSRAPGAARGRFGTIESRERVLVNDQTECNSISGLLLAQENNPLPYVGIDLAQNNRLIDIAPRQRLLINVSASDTARGITLTDQLILPRRIELSYTAETGALLTEIECEGETSGPPGVTVIPPEPALIGTVDWELPAFNEFGSWPALTPMGIFFPPTLPPEDPVPPSETGDCPIDAPANGPFNWGVSGSLISNAHYEVTIYVNAIIRSNGHDNKTIYAIQGTWLKRNATTGAWEPTLEDDMYQVYAYDAAGNIVATGQHDAVTNPNYRTGTLVAPAAVEIAYVRIVLDADLFRPTTIDQELVSHFWNERILGTLTHGFQGAGYWMKSTGSTVSGQAEGFEGHKFKIGARWEFDNKYFDVYQMCYGVISDEEGADYFFNDVYGHSQSAQIWYQDLAGTPNSFLLTKTAQNVRGGEYTSIRFEGYVGGGCGGYPWCHHKCTFNHFAVITMQANYMINLQNYQLWNICPRAAI